MAPNRYFVVMRDDFGNYLLATRTCWKDKAYAEKYAESCSQSRQPIVVEAPRGLEFRDYFLEVSN